MEALSSQNCSFRVLAPSLCGSFIGRPIRRQTSLNELCRPGMVRKRGVDSAWSSKSTYGAACAGGWIRRTCVSPPPSRRIAAA